MKISLLWKTWGSGYVTNGTGVGTLECFFQSD